MRELYQGFFHLGSMPAVSRYDVALALREYLGMRSCEGRCGKINEFGLKEKRPLKINLNIDKYKALTGKKEKPLEHFIEKFVSSRIIDPALWERNLKGNSLAYFARTKQAFVSRGMIHELIRSSQKAGGESARFCLHSETDENLQDMVILAYKSSTCRRLHQHRTGREAIHVIEGRMIALIFDAKGSLIDKRELDAEGEFAYRNNKGTYHIYFPITDYVVLREIRDGKNEPGETVPPQWDWVSVVKQHLSPEDWACHNKACKTPCSLIAASALK